MVNAEEHFPRETYSGPNRARWSGIPVADACFVRVNDPLGPEGALQFSPFIVVPFMEFCAAVPKNQFGVIVDVPVVSRVTAEPDTVPVRLDTSFRYAAVPLILLFSWVKVRTSGLDPDLVPEQFHVYEPDHTPDTDAVPCCPLFVPQDVITRKSGKTKINIFCCRRKRLSPFIAAPHPSYW
jgi:hypothetical protein